MTIALPQRARILVVALRRLGDVLLTTPLIRSLKHAWPDATIDVLVFAGTQGILAGNPDIATVLTIPARPGTGETLALLRKLWRRYDLGVSTQSGDRPTFYCLAAAARSVGFVEATGLAARAKASLLTYPVVTRHNEHRIREVLTLASALGIAPVAEVVAPDGPPSARAAPGPPYAVIHAVPMFRYKRWTDPGWRELAAGLIARGLAVVATGGPGEGDRLDAIWGDLQVTRLDGALSWPELAVLIRGASVYVGPDTSVTHLAAATGVPTVALYGPTDPRLWGPWPSGGLDPAWDATGTIQARRNVWLVQNPLPCQPCQLEGCLRRIDSHSQCLDELPPQRVLDAVDAALAGRQGVTVMPLTSGAQA
jgi:heptosyltransferase-3